MAKKTISKMAATILGQETTKNVEAILNTQQHVWERIAYFDVVSLTLKNNGFWYFKLNIKEYLPEAYREYKAALTFNEKPIQSDIDEQIRLKEKEQDKENLFGDILEKRMKAFDKEIANLEAKLKEEKAIHPDIEFAFTIEQIAWKDDGVTVIAIIDPMVIGKLNASRLEFELYKIRLTH